MSTRYETTNLLLLELGPFLLVVDQEASSGLGVTHLDYCAIGVMKGIVPFEAKIDEKKIKTKSPSKIKSKVVPQHAGTPQKVQPHHFVTS